MIQYPQGLPYPNRSGYGFTPVSPNKRTQMQSGRFRNRRNYSSVPTIASVSWSMNDLQAQLFESWFEDALISGTQWFECPLSSPQGDRLYQCRFVDIYTGPTEDGPGQWMFQAELELFERPILRGGWGLYAPEYFAQFGLIDEAMNREWPEFVFDYETYAAALADVENRANGDKVSIRSDETQGGNCSIYEAYVPPPSTLTLDFLSGSYSVYDKTATLTLVKTWAP